ncbi:MULTISPECIES: MarR family winged helix-turn-helix transcriptional regulator [Acinetobacter calcoaceticus/baumannii complex]|jgi:DNA-binding MarR family transcriptional regulator|uniref:MarR family winged helix-turn-helix transcriptional regulator n=1 Tax=Acinetobacter calcoaceticus/baumannii complex TaxID=909768 RepID=UPI001F3192B2|nr:MarR family transcriptional regulator [Acinetobacter pittii]MCE6234889.1 MarR family transcriptional regulator [Acinetobacter pittii]MCE6690413.1 MarR family transcriptional regulator [Acinetobacter pittii]MCE6697095.1 MarR family transcriptional regulator [Acinetobacter pittii]
MQKINIDRHATAQINMLANKLMLKSSTAYTQKFGIGMTEWRIISVLSSTSDCSVQKISDILGLDKAAVSRTIKKLEEKKYIEVKGHSEDKRTYVINLTQLGEELYEVASEFALERERRLLETLEETEKDQLFNLLKKLHSNVEEM